MIEKHWQSILEKIENLDEYLICKECIKKYKILQYVKIRRKNNDDCFFKRYILLF